MGAENDRFFSQIVAGRRVQKVLFNITRTEHIIQDLAVTRWGIPAKASTGESRDEETGSPFDAAFQAFSA